MFEKGDKVIFIGKNLYDLVWTNGSYPTTVKIDMQRFEECTVEKFHFGSGGTFLVLEGYNGIHSTRNFCYPNDKRLRINKLKKIINKI